MLYLFFDLWYVNDNKNIYFINFIKKLKNIKKKST